MRRLVSVTFSVTFSFTFSFKPQSLGCAVARRKSSTTLIFPLPPQACAGKDKKIGVKIGKDRRVQVGGKMKADLIIYNNLIIYINLTN